MVRRVTESAATSLQVRTWNEWKKRDRDNAGRGVGGGKGTSLSGASIRFNLFKTHVVGISFHGRKYIEGLFVISTFALFVELVGPIWEAMKTGFYCENLSQWSVHSLRMLFEQRVGDALVWKRPARPTSSF